MTVPSFDNAGTASPPMRTRRVFLASASTVAAAGLAGCTGDGGDADGAADQSDGGDGPTNESDDGPTNESSDGGAAADAGGGMDGRDGNATDADGNASDGSGTPAIKVTGIEVPERVGIGDDFDVTVALANGGDGDGAHPIELHRRGPTGGWQRIHTENVSVAAGENATVTVSGVNSSVVGAQRFRVGRKGPTATTAVGGALREYGESFTTDGVTITVEEPGYRRDYTWQDGDAERSETAPREQTYAWVTVNAENVGETRSSLPTAEQFALLVDGDQVDVAEVKRERERYEGGSVLPDVSREGWVAFQVPMQLAEERVRIAWDRRGDDGEVQAYWGTEEVVAEA